jgi:DNA helicase-2/ATP-dependent DNA helicase PcrA
MNLLYQSLNKKQQEAVENLEGPILIVAGAGSGKTRTLTSRLAAILASGVTPESIVAITFTNKAAEEMRNRIMNYAMPTGRQELGIMNKIQPFIGTFHSLGARILKNEAKFVGRTPNFSIFDADDSLRLIKTIVKNLNFSEFEKKKEANPLFLRKEFSRIKSELSDSEDEDNTIKFLFKEYEAALQKNNAFDFDDLIAKPVEIFQNHLEVLDKYQKKFRYLLVDEFQDTNTAQYVFVKLLAAGHRNLSVVGDDQQSIYKFRGSNFKIFLNFEKDWPKTKTVFLEQNYRSTGNIIKAASSLIAKNKFQKRKNLWTENDDGNPVKAIEHCDEDGEAEWIAEKISNFSTSTGRQEFPISNKSIAILYRTNAQSRAVESALIERGIAYKIFGGVKFYERKEIKDIVAILRWAFNPNDTVSFERIKINFLKKPFLEIQNKIPKIAKELPPAELISFILEITGYLNQLKKNYDNFREREENINELIYYASEFNNLQDFLEKISLFQSSDAIKKSQTLDSQNIINLMTIHLAKGLEFDAVFIVGCNEGLLPHQMSYHNDEEIEEERRLMYVAMTRAKKELFLNFYNLPSRFLYEIAPETVEFTSNNRDKFETLSDFLDDEERYIEY